MPPPPPTNLLFKGLLLTSSLPPGGATPRLQRSDDQVGRGIPRSGGGSFHAAGHGGAGGRGQGGSRAAHM